jgi:RNase H-like domain found in reverse transcriptase/Reverse transcriptase (RNA-dependent DNA polymerase)/Integrase zinc binding domain/Integrase core domain
MDKIKGAKFFTKFDVWWGYNNVRIRTEDQWKAAFTANRGLFKPTIMFFGMCNSLATFQAMMDSIFSDMIEGCMVIIYMDNILIFANNQEDLQKHTKMVLQQLQEHNLFLKPKKCEFDKTMMEYLGLIIQKGKLSMDSVKLSGIQDWPIPNTVKQVREFLGFANFYQRFIKKFSKLVLPLNNLLQKDTKFEWNPECQKAFKILKGRFLQEPVLMMPNHSKPFQIELDASKYASEAVLTQTDINGDRHLVAFLSKTFTDMERRYKIYDRELLGIVQALKEWQHYIQGSGHMTLVHTDHWNLTYFRKAQKLLDRQARWSLFISELDIKLQHLPGNKMVLSDALSRRPDHFPEEDKTKEEILLPDDLFLNLLDVDLRDRITKNKEYDFNVTKAIELLQEEGPMNIQNNLEDWKIEEVDNQKTIFYKGKQYIPKDQELQWDILKLFHDHETAGHPGELEMYNAVKQHYWWPGLWIFVKNYVKGCGICQQFKIDRNPSHPSFIPVEGAISTRPFAHCSMDLITDLPPAEGSDSILVVVDQGLSKGVILCPTTKTVTMNGIGDLLHENLYKWFGLPDKMLSDRGPQFAAKAFRAMLSRLGVNLVLSMAYHPQMDGTMEHVNQEIEAYLAIYCHSHPETWKKNLATMEFTHNNRRHANWPKTSFEIIQGESPKALPLTYKNTKFSSIDDKIKQMMTDHDEALAAHELARARIAERRQNTFTPFTVEQKVWLDTRNMKTNYHKKIAPKREGPFEIEEVLGPVTYQLKLPITWKVHNMFHAVLLKPYIKTEVHRENFSRPIPNILDGEEVYNC